MAKFSPGPMVAEVRGSVGGTVFSRNRYGAYTRFRAKPTVSTTEFAMLSKARMTAATQAWQELTAAQKLGWNHWAASNPVVGSLGEQQILTGHVAYVGNHSRALASGETPLTVPPLTPAPEPLQSMSLDYDVTLNTGDLTFAATPLAATIKLWIKGCRVYSSGINYVENLFRLFALSLAAQASPRDIFTAFEIRFGDVQAGDKIILNVFTFDTATMLLGAPLRCEEIAHV